LVSVTVCDVEAPTFTFPKASLVGLTASNPVPVPERATVWVPFEASLTIESVALNAAAAFGVNEILKLVLCPAESATGSVGAVNAKYLVENDALVILTV